MHPTRTMSFAIFVALLALASWALVILFAWTISDLSAARVNAVLDEEKDSTKQAAALRLHTLVRETEHDRATLAALASSDVVHILDTIDSIGKDANVDLKIGQAQGSPATDQGLRSVAFALNAEGSFDAVIKAAALIAALPIPSYVDQFQFERLPNADRTLWRLGAHVRFLTTENISL